MPKNYDLEERTAKFAEKEKYRELWQEAQQLTLIFSKIANSSKFQVVVFKLNI